MRSLKSLSDLSYAALRFMSGWMFAFHGAQKLFGVLAPAQMPPLTIGSQMWFGGVIEFFGGLMIAVGFQTRWAAFLCSGTMAVAYAQFHWKFQWNSGFFPAVNQGEMAVLYCFIFLLIACQGGGKFAVGKD
ncbi:MAG: DoxX family protein [Elusimicrobia bacterium]|nr:DoxX family protein [Elusimicrobiota bacterium]